MCAMVLCLLGAALVVALSTAATVLGFQWFTTYPFRWGWRRHAGAIGEQAPNGDPRLVVKPANRKPSLLAA
jgi:hypothetical protein